MKVKQQSRTVTERLLDDWVDVCVAVFIVGMLAVSAFR